MRNGACRIPLETLAAVRPPLYKLWGFTSSECGSIKHKLSNNSPTPLAEPLPLVLAVIVCSVLLSRNITDHRHSSSFFTGFQSYKNFIFSESLSTATDKYTFITITLNDFSFVDFTCMFSVVSCVLVLFAKL